MSISDASTSATPPPGGTATKAIALDVSNLDARYGQIQVLRGMTFSVNEGEVVVILGANGAGKTTTLRAICGMVATSGSIKVEGHEVRGKDTAEIVRRGVAHVPQGRGTFPELSVQDNLHIGAYVRKDRKVIQEDIDRWMEVFPRLGERLSQAAGSLSGGEQQMLAVARAMMSRPTLLLLDEPSLGLAPLIIEDLFRRFGEINKETGTTMLVVEQNANLALDIADRGYVLESGQIVLSGSADELRTNDAVREAYLGA
jgi:branched-chain amino acid transport system ATP-binding protein